MSDYETPFVHMSDEEFVGELKSRLPERSWTFAHFIELERRGLEITEEERELHAALDEEMEKVREVGREVAKKLEAHFADTLRPLQKKLRETMASSVNLSGLKNVVPDVDTLVAPEFLQLPKGMTAGLHSISNSERAVDSTGLAKWDTPSLEFPMVPEPAEHILESRRLALEQANIAAAQLDQLNEIGDRLAQIRNESRSPRQLDWWMLGFTVVAATAAVVAAVVAITG